MSGHMLSALAVAAVLTLTTACSSESTSTGPVMPDDALFASGSSNTSNRIRLVANLTPTDPTFRRASGKAQWDSRDAGAQRELQMEVEDVAPGTQLNFFVAGVQYGTTQTADALGSARIRLSTQLGDIVPVSASGAVAEVKTAGGAGVVTGIFP